LLEYADESRPEPDCDGNRLL